MTSHESSNPERAETPVEVERKFLVDPADIPDLTAYEASHIRQGYIHIDADGSEERVRDKNGVLTHTRKGTGSLARTEIEREITETEFNELWAKTEGKRVEKTRYAIPHGHVIELDRYEKELAGLMTAEIEYADEVTALADPIPDWLGLEVTGQAVYKNQTLATQGLPG